MKRVLVLLLLMLNSVAAIGTDPLGDHDPTCVLVKGAVKNPGCINAVDDLTLTKALQQAGGFGDFADYHVLIWKSSERRFITVNEVAIRRKEEPDLRLKRGDVVVVHQRYGHVTLFQ